MRYDAPDWCPPFGIPRPTEQPPDDVYTDVAAWLTAQLDNAHTQTFELEVER